MRGAETGSLPLPLAPSLARWTPAARSTSSGTTGAVRHLDPVAGVAIPPPALTGPKRPQWADFPSYLLSAWSGPTGRGDSGARTRSVRPAHESGERRDVGLPGGRPWSLPRGSLARAW